MGELFAKIGPAFVKGFKTVAAGKTQADLGMQSPHLASAAVRLGRFAYISLSGWIVVSWYSGYVNERVPVQESWLTKFILPGGNNPAISPPDRPNKTLSGIVEGVANSSGTGVLGPAGQPVEELIEDGAKTLGIANVGTVSSKGRKLIPISPAQLGVPGSALPGYLYTAQSKQMPPYNATRYRGLLNVASVIAKQFGLKISSGYRPGSQGANGPDLHSVGLAFDLVGRTSDMKRAASWAAKNPGMFQEIFVHNEGSGLHLHMGFYPDAASIFNSTSNRYSRASARASTAPAQSVIRV
jgi:hypothetical protein